MELKELRATIKNSIFTETLIELEVTVDLPHIKESYIKDIVLSMFG